MDVSQFLKRYAAGERDFHGVALAGADLSRADLSEVNLNRADLSGANLSGANLSGAKLITANLGAANLSEAKLDKANLSGAYLGRAYLGRANLSEANLSKAMLYGADLSEANLRLANLGEADLRKADLSRANLIATNLIASNLSGADLSKANLVTAKLIAANLIAANLSGANLSGAKLFTAKLVTAKLITTNLSGAGLSKADLSQADLSQANLSGAYLIEADLSQAKLSRADLSKADLSRANLSEANLNKADLSGVKLSGANLDRTLLSEVEGRQQPFKKTSREWIESLQFLQDDFIKRLNGNTSLHCCEIKGYHSEFTVISGNKLKRIHNFSWLMAENYKQNFPIRKVFRDCIRGKLGEEVVKKYLSDLVTEVDYKQGLGGNNKVDFRLTCDPSIGIQVRARHGSIDTVEWPISSEEIEQNTVLVCILIKEAVTEFQPEYNLVLAGFLPTSMARYGRKTFSVGDLLYGGGLRSYLESLPTKNNLRQTSKSNVSIFPGWQAQNYK